MHLITREIIPQLTHFIFDLLKIHFMLKLYLLGLTLFTVLVGFGRYGSVLTDGVSQRMV